MPSNRASLICCLDREAKEASAIIPLGSQNRQELTAWASQLEFGFANFGIANFAIFLGVAIGRGAHLVCWNEVLAKYSACVMEIKATGLGLTRSILLYN
eukprot:7260123-Heterocapsa_arctica.AAC.1